MKIMEELLKNISSKDLEKLKILLSIIPQAEQKEVVTLRVFMEEYSNLIKQNRSKAYYTSVMSSFKHLKEYFGEQKAIQEIGLKEIENYSSYLQQKVNKGFYVYYRTLKAAFNKAVDWGYVKENYFLKIKLQKKQKVNPVFINSEQLLMISDQLKNGTIKDIVIFAFYTGMRLNEIINLTWRNIDLDSRIITVGDENFTTKGRNQRYIPICEEVLSAIENVELRIRQKDDGQVQNEKNKGKTEMRLVKLIEDASAVLIISKGFVFCKRDGSKYCGNFVSRKFKNACVAAGMDSSIHFHSLRHSFASNLVQKGISLYTIKELLGHSSISTTEIYSHLNMDTLREAIGKLDVNRPHPDPLPAEAHRRQLKKEKLFA
jgi:site-specific recombinase XerD